MNGLYMIMLFLFLMGTVSAGLNELGVFGVNIPESGVVALNDTHIRDLQSGAEATSLNYNFNLISILFSFMKVIGSGILAMFTVVPLIKSYLVVFGVEAGFATKIALLVQAPVTFVTLFGLFEWWTGRQVT